VLYWCFTGTKVKSTNTDEADGAAAAFISSACTGTSCMLTLADVCWRMLTYADACCSLHFVGLQWHQLLSDAHRGQQPPRLQAEQEVWEMRVEAAYALLDAVVSGTLRCCY
jgi:hypothetical protein